jgi:glycosyltransferase involved in cell wall biosynthesis
MKLLIQVPCYNEQDALPVTLGCLPRRVEGFDHVEWLIINDGSEDETVRVARELGVDHVVNLTSHRGLAAAFAAGIQASLAAGADVIVNTDADNQYNVEDLHRLTAHVLSGEADMVVGERPILEIGHFSPLKKLLQRIGSSVVRAVSGTDIRDAPSGFRAISREAALKINVFDEYTYTLETIIQAAAKGIRVLSVPVRTNEDLRASRLIRSTGSYLVRSTTTILRMFLLYRPLKAFFIGGLIPFLLGTALCVRWLALFLLEDSTRARSPSLIVAALLILVAFNVWSLGLVADLLAANRRLIEDLQYHARIRVLETADRSRSIEER